jgi:hypothetical protein
LQARPRFKFGLNSEKFEFKLKYEFKFVQNLEKIEFKLKLEFKLDFKLEFELNYHANRICQVSPTTMLTGQNQYTEHNIKK